MPAKKGRLKELEKRNAYLVETVEFQLKKIIKLESWLAKASPLEWIKSRDWKSAGDWEDESIRIMSEREEKGE